jgi:hypothetical protein
MQNELHPWAIDWINEHCDIALGDPNPVRYLRDQLASLLNGRVLCDAEPVAWQCPDDPERETAFSWKAGKCDSKGCGKKRVPLYAPADMGSTDRESGLPWPKGNQVKRREDMSPTGTLIVGLDSDNDVLVSIVGASDPDFATVEFCNGGGGGGKSPRTRRALIALMVAMEQDDADMGKEG